MTISELSRDLANARSIHEKIARLNLETRVQAFGEIGQLSLEHELVFKQLIAIGQSACSDKELLDELLIVDSFYREIGGLVGYHDKVLTLMGEKEKISPSSSLYHSPFFHDIAEETEFVREAISWGIDAVPELAEFFPLGGAADRLHLVDERTGSELPAAKLPFAGRTLLEHLIRDLFAREFLYYKKTGLQVTTPIAMMTSKEKNNHFHVLQICKEQEWFGRGEDSFRLFLQPLVPTLNEEGNWCWLSDSSLLMKPGGHGAIWKLARDQGIFRWLEKLGRKKALIRQINNPIAGLDYGLLAFTGLGWKKEMVFGFASCPRLLQAAEGVNVLIERKKGFGIELVLTNIEYCDFAKFGIQDLPLREGEPYSRFSSNTNILFADLQALNNAVDRHPFPGLLINLKKASYTTESGEKREEMAARLESTMQNIADVFTEEKSEDAPRCTDKTFVTYNRRNKTISTAKKGYILGKPCLETPENCFYDLMQSARELLEKHCEFLLPEVRTIEEYLKKGPEFVFLYHPALGPLYSLIGKKLQAGALSMGSELLLEIAEARIRGVDIQGSVQILANQVLGHIDEKGILRFSDRVGSCYLENITVRNRGVDWNPSQPYWKMELTRHETLKIVLCGDSSFHAKNVCFEGNHTFVVEDGIEMHVRQKGTKLEIERREKSHRPKKA